MVRFSSRFIPDFITITVPLRALTRNGVEFKWAEVQKKTFQILKEQLAEASILAYVDKTAHTLGSLRKPAR